MCVDYGTSYRDPLGRQLDPSLHIFLVLSGGGALGAFEVGVLKYLHEDLGISRQIKAVSGVSFGAINAAIYASNIHGDPIGALKGFYNDLTLVDSPLFPKFAPLKNTVLEDLTFDMSLPGQILAPFLNPNFYNVRTDLWKLPLWTYLYDNSRLRPILLKYVDFGQLNSKNLDDPQLIITAVNIETGEIEVFNNRKQDLTVDHILCSSSLPPAFKPTEVLGNRYWDGGLFDNTPFITLLRSLVLKDVRENGERTGRPTYKRVITVELFPRKGQLPSNPLDVFNRIIQIMFRVKVSQSTRDNIYEFGVLMNWLTRIFDVFEAVYEGPPAGHADPTAGRENEVVEGQQAGKSRVDLLFKLLKTFGIKREQFSLCVLAGFVVALNDYFEELRPDPRTGYATPPEEAGVPDGATLTFSVQRIEELNSKGLSYNALQGILQLYDFGQKYHNFLKIIADREDIASGNTAGLQPSPLFNLHDLLSKLNIQDQATTELIDSGIESEKLRNQQHSRAKTAADQLKSFTVNNFLSDMRKLQLITDQIALFSNVELLPIQATMHPALLSIGDYSVSAITKLYAAGIEAAKEQVRVVQLSADEQNCESLAGNTPRWDLQFTPAP